MFEFSPISLPNEEKSRLTLAGLPARNECEEKKRTRYEKNLWFNDQFPQQKSRLYRISRSPHVGCQFGCYDWAALPVRLFMWQSRL